MIQQWQQDKSPKNWISWNILWSADHRRINWEKKLWDKVPWFQSVQRSLMKVASQRAMHRLEKHLVSPEGTLIIQTLVVYPNAQYHTLNQQYPIIPKLKIHQNQNSIFSKSLLWLKICLNHTTITSYTGSYTRYVKCALENTFFTQFLSKFRILHMPYILFSKYFLLNASLPTKIMHDITWSNIYLFSSYQ